MVRTDMVQAILRRSRACEISRVAVDVAGRIANAERDGEAIGKRRSAASRRPRAGVAGDADGGARPRHLRGDRAAIRSRRGAAPAGASVLVPVARRGDGHGLALLGHHHQRARRAQARARARRASSAFTSAAAAAATRAGRPTSCCASASARLRRRALARAVGWWPRSTARRCRTASAVSARLRRHRRRQVDAWCSRA